MMKPVSWPGGYCNDRVCYVPGLWPAGGSRGTGRAETKGKLRISSGAAKVEGTGDKGYLESGEIKGLLANMIAREGRDKIVNGETHGCGMAEREESKGVGERVKYQALIDLELKGNQGRPTKRAHGQLPPGPRPRLSTLRLGASPVRLHPRIPSVCC
jgi:hypothetical protein